MSIGKILIFVGIGLFLLGLILSYAPGIFSWFGKLPGDIRIQDENKYIFIPITSMIIISLVLTLVINLFFRR
ncbi:DUF2905 domain-containing protein [Methylocaldum szegediense]|uniref:Uncharacterized membrane protein YrzS n=1 Tax=Methylocaldum szegediense TaxID=73780 RepID=A0ABM9I7L1_9GAMM|nr:DUF2905 domain-containing protein [Methylocaldum szegediense]CAI8942864.1 putative Uncharacterized membrane protein YrzS [Methylocaldum szegediense]